MKKILLILLALFLLSSIGFCTTRFYSIQKSTASLSSLFLLKSGDIGTGNLTLPTELIGSTANFTDFPNAKLVASQGNTGHTYTGNIGSIGEAISSGSDTSTGIGGVASSKGIYAGRGVCGVGKVSTSTDTANSIGVFGRALDTHIGGNNIGIYSNATGGLNNYSFYGLNGNIYNNGNIQATYTVSASSGYFNVVSASTYTAHSPMYLQATNFNFNNRINTPNLTTTYGINAGTITANGSLLTALNATQLTSGTIPNARIDYTSVTLQGNTFNVANKLTKLDSSGNISLSGTVTANTITSNKQLYCDRQLISNESNNYVDISNTNDSLTFMNNKGTLVQDLSYTSYDAFGGDTLVQVFTPTKTGLLGRASFYKFTGGAATITLKIYKGSGTGGTLIYNESGISISGNAFDVNLTNPVLLFANNTYTFLVTTTSGSAPFVYLTAGTVYYHQTYMYPVNSISCAPNSIVFNNSVTPTNTTTLSITAPTTARTITIPNATGIVALTDNPTNISAPNITSTYNLTVGTITLNTSINNISTTELNYLDNVTSNIQTQINTKQSTLTGGIVGTVNQVNVTANYNTIASTITLSLPQSIATTSSPTFANQTLTYGLRVSTITSTYTGTQFAITTSTGINITGNSQIRGNLTISNTITNGDINIYKTDGSTQVYITSNGTSYLNGGNLQIGKKLQFTPSSTQVLYSTNTITSTTSYSLVTSTGGVVVLSSNPQITAGDYSGQILIVRGTSNTNTITLSDGNGLDLDSAASTFNLGLNDNIVLLWNGTVWAEVSRKNN